MIFNQLKRGDKFTFVGSKTVYRVLAKGAFYLQYENPKRLHSLYELGYKNKKYYAPVRLVTRRYKKIIKTFGVYSNNAISRVRRYSNRSGFLSDRAFNLNNDTPVKDRFRYSIGNALKRVERRGY